MTPQVRNKKALVTELIKLEDEAARRKRNRKGQKAPKIRNAQQRASFVDDYLLAVLDPEYGPNVGVPDEVTLRSVQFNTVAQFELDTNTATTGTGTIFAVAPTLRQNFLRPGTTSLATNLNLIRSGFGATSTVARVNDFVVPAPQLAYIEANYSAVRPVGMAVECFTDQALLTVTGSHGARLCPGEAIPWTAESAASLAVGITSNPQFGTANAPNSMGEILSSFTEMSSVKERLKAIWSPADALDRCYRATLPSAASAQGWAFQPTTYTPTAQSPTNYVFPFRMSNSATQTTLSNGIVDGSAVSVQKSSPPYILYAADGLSPGQKTFVRIVTKWQAIPRPGVIGTGVGSVSPSDPQKLAHATTVLEAVPKVSFPNTEGDRATQIQAAAVTTAKSSSGLQGLSSALKSLGKGALSMAAPALGAVPGLGPGLSVGASLLSAML